MTTDILQFPDRSFTATTTNDFGHLLECRPLWCGRNMALEDPVIEETPLKDCGWATLFAYLHRRFGPPHVGGDDYKDLSAGWVLSTPDPEVFVSVSPHLCGTYFSFTCYLSAPEHTASGEPVLSVRDLDLPAERAAEIRAAYRATLLDLLRPVCVRDQHINALGELEEETEIDAALLEYDEDNDEPIYEVRYHETCGWPMPSGLFGGDDWAVLCGLITRHGETASGETDYATGRAAVIRLLQEKAFAKASCYDWPVQRLMLMSNPKHRHHLIEGLRRRPAEVRRFDAEMEALYDRETPDLSIIDEMTDENVARACELLDELGYGDHGLEQTVRRLRRQRSTQQAWQDLVSFAKDDFPVEDVSEEDLDTALARPDQLAVILSARLEERGRPDLLAWIDRTAARPEGLGALAKIVAHIVNVARKEA